MIASLNIAAAQALNRPGSQSRFYVGCGRIVLESSLEQGDFNGEQIHTRHRLSRDRGTGKAGRRSVAADPVQAQWASVGGDGRTEGVESRAAK